VRLHLVAEARLWEVFERSRGPHVRRHALALMGGAREMARSPLSHPGMRPTTPRRIVARARGASGIGIGRFNRSFATPSSEDLRRVGTPWRSPVRAWT